MEAESLLRKLIIGVEKQLATSHIVARFDAFWMLYCNFNADNGTIKTMIREKFDSTLDRAGGPAALEETAEVIRSFLPDIQDAVVLVDKALNKNTAYLDKAARLLNELKEMQEKRQRVNTASARVDDLSKMLAQAHANANQAASEYPVGATDAESLAKMLGGVLTGYESGPGMSSTEAEGSATEAEGAVGSARYGANNPYSSAEEQQQQGPPPALTDNNDQALANMLVHLAAHSPSDGSGSLDVAALSGLVLPAAPEVEFGTDPVAAAAASAAGVQGLDPVANADQMQEQLLASYMELMKINENHAATG